MTEYTDPAYQIEQRIYRTRDPVTVGDKVGYLDFWTSSPSKAKNLSLDKPGRLFESLTLSQIDEMTPIQIEKARRAWESVCCVVLD